MLVLSDRICTEHRAWNGVMTVFRILSKDVLAPDVVRFWIEGAHIARKRKPGQFVIVRASEQGERIPLTIADVDKRRGAISIVVQGVGKSTRQLNSLEPGDSIPDVAGPLGRGTDLRPGRRVCCIGGGIGTAVVYPIASGFKALQGHVVVIIGGRTRDLIILEPELRAVADRVIVTTDDGSYGAKGLVTDALQGLLNEGLEFDEVVAVGPLPMMKAVVNVTRPLNIPTTVSLNPIMVDGTGMCGGCRVSVGGEQKFVCVDGPEFDGFHVDFDELGARLRAYRDQEQEALRLYNDTISCQAPGS
jgi:ferredoxin--NADP+ reductase